MPEFIEPIAAKIIEVLGARTPELLVPELPVFGSFGLQFTGVATDAQCWVIPASVDFDDAVTCRADERVRLTIKFAVLGDPADPNDVARRAMKYMSAIHRALAASWTADWTNALADGQVTRLFVEGHDYGPLRTDGQSIAKFPELHLAVYLSEAWRDCEGV